MSVPLRAPGRGAAALLLELLRGGAAPADGDARWGGALALAERHGVAGLLHAHHPDLPPRARRAFVRARARALAQQLALDASLARAEAALAARPAIPALRLKGAATARLYGAPELRPRGDNDLLVPPERFAQACARLQAAGFAHHPRTRRGPEESPGWHERTFEDLGAHGAALDLHQGLLQPQRTRLDAGALFARARDGLPAPEDEVLVLALSLAGKELAAPLSLAADLLRLLPQADPAALAARAREVRAARALGLALAWLQALAGVAEQLAFAPVGRPRLAEAARALALSRLARRTLAALAGAYDLSRARPGRARQLWRKALLVDRPGDVLRLAAATAGARARRALQA